MIGTSRTGSGEVAHGAHAAIACFRRGEGSVFNAGSADWARALAQGDPGVAAITRAVLRALASPARARDFFALSGEPVERGDYALDRDREQSGVDAIGVRVAGRAVP